MLMFIAIDVKLASNDFGFRITKIHIHIETSIRISFGFGSAAAYGKWIQKLIWNFRSLGIRYNILIQMNQKI